jgi:anti-sigma factor RsiW
MSHSHTTAPAPQGHASSELLQAALDDTLDTAEHQQLGAHLDGCDRCKSELLRLRALDGELGTHLVPASLDANFERRVFDEIGRLDGLRAAAERAAARVRVEQQDVQLSSALEQAWWSTRHMLLAKGAAIITLTAAAAVTLPAAFPGLAAGLATRSQEYIAAAAQPLVLTALAVVATGFGLLFSLRRTQLA